MNHVEKGHYYHDRGFGCAQAVLAAFCEDFGLDVETALKISTGFGSGMGRVLSLMAIPTVAMLLKWDNV